VKGRPRPDGLNDPRGGGASAADGGALAAILVHGLKPVQVVLATTRLPTGCRGLTVQ
jgi:hypothetical protein